MIFMKSRGYGCEMVLRSAILPFVAQDGMAVACQLWHTMHENMFLRYLA
jgi:hypothetical protein